MPNSTTNKILILEGPRCSGKTTIAHALTTKGWTEFKRERGEDPYSDMLALLHEWEDNGKDMVSDRFHLTEFIMSMLLQRAPITKLSEEMLYIDTLLYGMGAKIAFLYPPFDVIAGRYMRRNDGRPQPIPLRIEWAAWAMIQKWLLPRSNYMVFEEPNWFEVHGFGMGVRTK